jgi:hypothetical protein
MVLSVLDTRSSLLEKIFADSKSRPSGLGRTGARVRRLV